MELQAISKVKNKNRSGGHDMPFLKEYRSHPFVRKTLAILLVLSIIIAGYCPFAKFAVHAEDNNAAAKPFMDAPTSMPDFSSLTAKNWMSGLDNSRYLNEVNIPGAHDACTQHMYQALTELKNFGEPFAECQDMQYQNMLDNGVRLLDLRLNNWYLESLALPWWVEVIIRTVDPVGFIYIKILEWILEKTDANKEDDGQNCYIVHGDNSWGRTYWAMKSDDADEFITFSNVLDTCKKFLKENPSETIILYLADETTDKNEVSKIRARAKGILQSFSSEINPSTGESYLFMENGEFKTYTVMPTVGDVRGKVVIASNSASDFGVGMDKNSALGYKPGEKLTFNEENNYDVDADEKWEKVKYFFDDHVTGKSIPLNLDQHLDYINSIYTSSNSIPFDNPKSIAEEINPKVYTGSDALIQGAGTYYGWVLGDCVSGSTAKPVWKSNFPDNLEYCKVTVKTGSTGGAFTSPDQTYYVMKGHTFLFPGDIYDELHGYEINFAGWNIGDRTYVRGERYTVENDVTIVAGWEKKAEIPIEIRWEDDHNYDGIRPSSVQLDLVRNDGKYHYNPTVTENADREWKCSVSVYVSAEKTAVGSYNLSVIHNEVITGNNTPTSYKDEVDTTQEGGYKVTLKHSKNLYTVDGKIEWSDASDQDGARPSSVTVRLKEGNTTVASKNVSSADCDPNDPDKWKLSFEGIPYRNEKGIITYIMECEWQTDYLYTKPYASGTAVDTFTLVNTHEPSMLAANCEIIWVDGDDPDKRPDSVDISLMKNSSPAGNLTLSADSSWMGTFGSVPKYDHGKPIIYTVSQDSIVNYSTQTSFDPSNGFIITNTYMPETTSVNMAAHWMDADNQDGKRPGEITARLCRNGEATETTLRLSSDNNWSDCFSGLEVFGKDGKEINYEVVVDPFDSQSYYTLTRHGDSHAGYDFVCEHIPETVSLHGAVIWDDGGDKDGIRPTSVNLAVRQAGGTVARFRAEAGAESGIWTWKNDAMPAYMPGKQGEALKYIIAAASAVGYNPPVVSQSDDGRWIVTYHRDPQTVDITGIVNWDDDENRDGLRPDQVDVMLWRDGEECMGTREASAGGGWTYDFGNVPRYEGEGSDKREIAYHITASEVKDYQCTASGFDLDYVHTPAVTTVQVTQIWNDGDDADGLRLNEITASLYADGQPTGNPMTLSAGTNWMAERTVPRNEHGVPIVYTIVLDSSAAETLRTRGYSVDLVKYGPDDWSIVATRAPETVALKGTVAWDDGDDSKKLRPKEVILTIKGPDTPEATVLVMADKDGRWNWTADDLVKRSGGQEIAYEVSQDSIKYYTTTVTGSIETGFTVTNTLVDFCYTFTEGDGSSWQRGSDKALGFTVKRSRDDSLSFSRFTGIEIDGREVPQDAYTATGGSVILSLKPAGFAKLSDGRHTITARFSDGSAEAHFTIASKPADFRYTFTEGDGSSWQRGSNKTLGFTVKRSRDDSSSFSRFTGITIDGKEVPQDAYTASEGSVILILKPAGLKKLSDGIHTITARFSDGSAEAHFTVTTPSNPVPDTSDILFDKVLFWSLMLLASVLTSIITGTIIRKRTENKVT